MTLSGRCARRRPRDDGFRFGALHLATPLAAALALGMSVPSVFAQGPDKGRNYVVRDGDTMAKIAERELGSKDAWPALWARNPEVTNPHWIYPGMRLRLKGEAPTTTSTSALATPASATSGAGAKPPPMLRQGELARAADLDAIRSLRHLGFVRGAETARFGRVVAAPSDKTLMSTGDLIYLHFRASSLPRPGNSVDIFRRFPLEERSALRDKGELVMVFGKARVLELDPMKRMARAVVTESLEPIERGLSVGALGDAFVVLKPHAATVRGDYKVSGTVRPRTLVGDSQFVLIEGPQLSSLSRGTLVEVVRRGDPWHEIRRADSLLAPYSVRPPSEPPADHLPDERIGIGIVVDPRPDQVTVYIVEAQVDIAKGDRVFGLTR